MYEPESLLTVSRALSSELQALPHIVESVSDFLMPATIDGAVYKDLKRVVKAHGGFRAWTVKAMDGAAATGRLEIMKWLRDNRTEGCSTEACLAAAIEGHLDVVKWLSEFYTDEFYPVEAMTLAAQNGHVSVVHFLRNSVAMHEAVPIVEDAAVNGRVDVVDALVPYYSGLAQEAFMVASANGQTEVVRRLLCRGFTSVMYTHPSLRGAIEGGHAEAVDLLLEFCDNDALGGALRAAVAVDRADILQLIVERHHPRDIGEALEQATLGNRCAMVQLLLENCPEEDDSYLSALNGGEADRWQAQRSINAATTAAASRGFVETAKLLATKCSDSAAGLALKVAVELNHLEMAKLFVMKSNPVGRVDALVTAELEEQSDMAKLLLEHGDLRMVEQALVKISSAGNQDVANKLLARCDSAACKRVFESAAANGVVGLVQQMLAQVDERSAGEALRLAAMNGHCDVVKVLLVKSDAEGVTNAFNVAAMQGRLAVVELLSEHD